MTRVGIPQTGQMIDASAVDFGPATMAPDALHRSPCIFHLAKPGHARNLTEPV
jgi:hypothetical protein